MPIKEGRKNERKEPTSLGSARIQI
jgi:hypothetical protein